MPAPAPEPGRPDGVDDLLGSSLQELSHGLLAEATRIAAVTRIRDRVELGPGDANPGGVDDDVGGQLSDVAAISRASI